VLLVTQVRLRLIAASSMNIKSSDRSVQGPCSARLVHGGQQVVAARLQQHQGIRQVVDVLRRAREVRELRHLWAVRFVETQSYFRR